mmetsp:Transcript_26099/g.47118  ORF Transcript_26099/g.47118 Transcript_26099/m.47118 type:complete len:222 (+) Transcript_26099:2-667(+)
MSGLNASKASDDLQVKLSAEIKRLATGIKPPMSPYSGDEEERHCLSEIIPGKLILTGWKGAYYREAVQAAGVTHVASIGSEFEGETPLADLGISYLCVIIDDEEEQASTMQDNLKRAVDFLDEGVGGGGKALVHCAAGISRSTTVVLAYMVAKCDMTLLDAFRRTYAARPVVWPNTGFMKILIAWETSISKKPATVRLSQYKLWSDHDPKQYALAKVVDRD